ncbi:uncharacterized protein LOC130711939 isoform X2 [Lotus japonicus]|uniref:uncharacterized protein LOC130711939 isoform X2 n=1 Tax=Lotus japonicus TaxID=34305 RepID=UPI0025897A12|nr:uncharacterized protein LOC130711939 isoform X2 [Lotus japonicus]
MVQKRPFDTEEILEVSFKHPKQEGHKNQFMSFEESVFPEDGCVPRTSERPTRTLVRYENSYSMLFKHPPTTPVPVGPDHQADIPAWDSSATSRPNPDAAGDNKDEERLMGTCIIPMPQMKLSIYDNEEVGKGRTDDCSCGDRGSVRCVRQHIVEAREELVKSIGKKIFADLGLADMGEQVADKWSAEEEQLFLKVIFNSPVTLDKTFWDYFPIAFPLKTKREMVSYYFNVFMLRRRGEQNRNSLLAIDSDDDEWQGSGDGNGIETGNDDEDCVTESPESQDDACLAKSNCHENYLQGNDEYASDETCAVKKNVYFTERNIDDDSRYPSAMTHFIGLSSPVQPRDQTVWRERFDEDVHDDSCTSCDAGVASQKTENGDHWFGNYNGEHNGYSQGYVLDPFDAEVWDSVSVLHWK